MPDDPGVAEQARDVVLTERGDGGGIESANACRNASRLRRIVSHERPDWNPSRQIFSNSRRSSVTGKPHSASW